MTMQLFSFGHPCEHQLRRTCIGGTSCPLNGYPDNWCCSYIKGKINFKRDKPCEGTRCRWGFTHPSQSQFDAVTLVMNESRPIAVKIDDAEDKDLLTFNIENTHVVDTVQCALHMMRRPPSSCTTRVGQLLAYAAVRTGDSKVFMQLLKTMKKPFDGYLLGAYDYLTSGNLPSATAASASASASASSTAAAAAAATAGEKNSKSLTKRGSASAGSIGGGGGEKKDKDKDKDSAVDELRNGMVDLMSAALSSGGQLVHRDDQHTLQAVFVQALRGYPKGNRRRQEMLEAAVAKFGARAAAAAAGKGAAPPVAGIAAASAAHAAAIAAIAAAQSAHTHSPASHANANANTNANTAAAASPGHNNNNNSSGAAANATSATNAAASAANSANHAAGGGGSGKKAETAAAAAATAAATADDEAAASHTPRSRENSDSATVRGGRAQGTTASTSNARQKEAATPVPHNHIAANNTTTHTTTTTSTTTNSSSNNNNNNAHLGNSGGGANAGAAIPVTRTPAAAVVPVKQAPIVGISRVARVQSAHVTRRYDPVRTDLPLPDILLFGGLFGLTQRSAASSLLGNASNRAPPSNASASVAASGDTRSSSAMDPGGNAINDKVFHILHSPEPECNPFLDADAQQLLRGIYED